MFRIGLKFKSELCSLNRQFVDNGKIIEEAQGQLRKLEMLLLAIKGRSRREDRCLAPRKSPPAFGRGMQRLWGYDSQSWLNIRITQGASNPNV